MKPGYTHIAVVLDRSGSMKTVATDTIGGFNNFLEDQQKQPGEATLTLVGFDDQYEVWRDFAALKDVHPLDAQTFVPRGWTALLDAIGRTITEMGARLEKLPEGERPEKVVIAIMTDGQENHSTKFDSHRIAEMISHQRDAYNWQFLFLGANQDAITTAASMNIPAAAALTYQHSSGGVRTAMRSFSANVGAYRRMAGPSARAAFTPADREAQEKVGLPPQGRTTSPASGTK